MQYAAFLPLVVILYYVLPKRFSAAVLLLSSYAFYAFANPILPVILLVITAISYICAQQMQRRKNRVFLFVAGVILTLLPLILLKYIPAFTGQPSLIAGLSPIETPSYYNLLPVGLAFCTLSAIGWLFAVYSGKIKTLPRFGTFALYIAFFPKLLAGPLEEPEDLIPQFETKKHFSTANISRGLRLILWGLFKKILIADYIAVYVNGVFKSLKSFSGLSLTIAMLLFCLQLYADISAYLDIAAGSAKLFGIDFKTNFTAPFLAKSFGDFWQRWFISLGGWLKKHIYSPLAQNKKPATKCIAVLLCFVLAAVWHKLSLNFMLWAVIQSVLIIGEGFLFKKKILAKIKSKHFKSVLKIMYRVFVFAITILSFAILRAESPADIGYLLTNLHKGANPLRIWEYISIIGIEAKPFIHILICSTLLFATAFANKNGHALAKFEKLPLLIRYASYYALAFFILWRLFTLPTNITPGFLYFAI